MSILLHDKGAGTHVPVLELGCGQSVSASKCVLENKVIVEGEKLLGESNCFTQSYEVWNQNFPVSISQVLKESTVSVRLTKVSVLAVGYWL